MNFSEIIAFDTQIIFILLSIVAIGEYIRRPSPRRRDFALMASALGIPFAVTLLRNMNLYHSGTVDLIGAFVLFSQPYFLFRLLQYYHPRRPGVGILVVIGSILCCGLIAYRMGPDAASTVVLIFSYCAVAEAYCTLGFYQGMQNTEGTLRQRLRVITISSAIFTLAFVINVVKAQFPYIAPTATPVAQIAVSISAIFFYIAFIPPRWLRRTWQLEELGSYLSESRTAPTSESFVSENLRQLNERANRSTNGIGSGVLKLDETAGTVLAATDPALFANLLQHHPKFLRRAWDDRQPSYHFLADIPDERDKLQSLGAQTWLMIPIQGDQHLWGLLVVALQDRLLFIDEDLSMLALLAQECALILDHHRLIDELQNYSEGLERKVEERTAALQRSNEELRRYAYVASHDLQEPLRNVTSYLQLIEQRFADKLNEEGREFIAFAVNGALRMKNLINDLLMYSRIDSHAQTFMVVDFQRVLDKTKLTLAVLIAETETCISHDAMPRVMADEEVMLHLFQNLIENAIKYRSARKPEIHVGAALNDQQWLFSVRDNGIGMEKQYLEQIFIMFKRLHTQDVYPGTGIGLAVCKKAVELHGGRIWAESELGQGTTFYFTLPIRETA